MHTRWNSFWPQQYSTNIWQLESRTRLGNLACAYGAAMSGSTNDSSGWSSRAQNLISTSAANSLSSDRRRLFPYPWQSVSEPLMPGALFALQGHCVLRRGQGLPPFPRTPFSACGTVPPLRSGQVSLDEAEHFTAQSSCQRWVLQRSKRKSFACRALHRPIPSAPMTTMWFTL